MKNRFYYSERQQNIDKEVWDMPTQYALVKTPNGYKQFSEWCTIKGTKCNWSDAVLVYECDNEPKIITHENIPQFIEKQDQQIHELQEQLKNAIVPKFRIGQRVYIIDGWDDSIEENTIEKIVITKNRLVYYFQRYANSFSETEFFATKEEAEQKLKELKERD